MYVCLPHVFATCDPSCRHGRWHHAKRKSTTPVGIDDFSKGLAKSNMPHKLIRNPDRLREMNRWMDGGYDKPRPRGQPAPEDFPTLKIKVNRISTVKLIICLTKTNPLDFYVIVE